MNLLFAVLFGAIGMGYMVYGKKQQQGGFLLAGFGLIAFSYLVSNPIAVAIIGLALTGAPFLFRQ